MLSCQYGSKRNIFQHLAKFASRGIKAVMKRKASPTQYQPGVLYKGAGECIYNLLLLLFGFKKTNRFLQKYNIRSLSDSSPILGHKHEKNTASVAREVITKGHENIIWILCRLVASSSRGSLSFDSAKIPGPGGFICVSV